MKNREEFMQSVWEKSEKALAEERIKKARRRRAGGLTAAAACLALVIGITSAGGPEELMEGLLGGMASDGAAIEMQDNYDSNGIAPGQSAASTALNNSDTYDTPADSADDMEVSYDGALPGASKLSDEELYKVIREETEAAQKSNERGLMGYICLPIGVLIEDGNGSLVTDTNAYEEAGTEEKLIMEYMQWFYRLPGDQVLTTEEFESLNESPTGYYKFTMDFSPGEDTEGVYRIFYITGEVTLP